MHFQQLLIAPLNSVGSWGAVAESRMRWVLQAAQATSTGHKKPPLWLSVFGICQPRAAREHWGASCHGLHASGVASGFQAARTHRQHRSPPRGQERHRWVSWPSQDCIATSFNTSIKETRSGIKR